MSKAPTIYVENKDGDVLDVNATRSNMPNLDTTWYETGKNDYNPDSHPFLNYPTGLDWGVRLLELEDWYAGWYDAATEYELAITGEC